MRSLIFKRLIIFGRRYILALIILLFPLLSQTIISSVIPTSSVLENKSEIVISELSSYKFDISNYGPEQIFLYSLNDTSSSSSSEFLFINEMIKQFYSSKRNQLNLFQLNDSSSSLNNYVTNMRRNKFSTIYDNYFMGMNWQINSNNNTISQFIDVNTIKIDAFFSTMAYHSSGTIVNEISNLLLYLLNSNKTDKSITTINRPLSSNDSNYIGDEFLKYLGCFDILPLSIFNFSTSLIVAFIMSSTVMHISKEKMNGSRNLQLLSGSHRITYWISNYVFDYLICLINIAFIIGIIVIIDGSRTDKNSDISVIAMYPTIGYVILILVVSSFSWPLYGYCWANYFKSDVNAFVILIVLLFMASFFDVVFAFIQIFNNLSHVNDTTVTFYSPVTFMMYILRILLSILFPNVTIKRQLFNFRLRTNRDCIFTLNNVIKSNYSYDSAYTDIQEPGIGLFLIISFLQLFACIIIFIGIETKLLSKHSFMDFYNRIIKKKKHILNINSPVSKLLLIFIHFLAKKKTNLKLHKISAAVRFE